MRGLARMKRALMAATDVAVHYMPKKRRYRRRTIARGFKPVRVKRRRQVASLRRFAEPRRRGRCEGKRTR